MRRMLLRVCGFGLIALGIAMPRGWYDTLPVLRAGLPAPPIRGVTLLQLSLVLDGLALLWFSWRRSSFASIAPHGLLARRADEGDATDDVSAPAARWWLIVITVLALALRLWHLNSGLWLDEITPLLDYSGMRAYQVVAPGSPTGEPHELAVMIHPEFAAVALRLKTGQRDSPGGHRLFGCRRWTRRRKTPPLVPPN